MPSTLVQRALGEGTAVTSVTATYPAATTAGNTLIAVVGAEQTATTSTFTFPSGWSVAVQADRGADACKNAIIYRENAPSVTSVQVTFSAALDAVLEIQEYSGLLSSASLDKTVTANGTGTAAASGLTATTAQADELVIGTVTSSSGATQSSFTPTGWTTDSNESTNNGTAAARATQSTHHKNISTAAAQEIGCTISSSREWIASVATFKASSASTTGTASLTEAADVIATTASQNFIGTSGLSEASDTVSASASQTFSGPAALAESTDSIATTASQNFLGTSSITEAADAVAATASQEFSGTAALNESPDSIVGVDSNVSGPAALTESADTVSASGNVLLDITGTAGLSEATDSVSASGQQGFSGTSTLTSSAQSIQSTGVLQFIGTAGLQGSSGRITTPDHVAKKPTSKMSRVYHRIEQDEEEITSSDDELMLLVNAFLKTRQAA